MVGPVGSEESAPTELLRGENQTSSESSAEPQEAQRSLKMGNEAGEGHKIYIYFFGCCQKMKVLSSTLNFIPGAIVLSVFGSL